MTLSHKETNHSFVAQAVLQINRNTTVLLISHLELQLQPTKKKL